VDRRSIRSRGGFTLLEVLVALVIFGVITVALSFTFDTALMTQKANNRRLEELGEVRSVFGYITRDVQQAYATSNSASSVFIAGGGQSAGPQSASGSGLLSLVTRGNRINANPQTGAPTGPTGPPSGTDWPPQSETVLVRYDFDPPSHSLTRTVLPVPNYPLLQQTPTDPNTTISSRIDNISFRFWDPTALSWRDGWDYEQQNQQSATSGSGAAATAAASGAGSSVTVSSSTSSNTGDTTLPASVEVTVSIRHQDGSTATYVSTIPIVTSPVADGMAPPTNPGSGSTTTGAPQ
jgi:prepilin-type N-terminal cleavage/methylation domain-containing protein